MASLVRYLSLAVDRHTEFHQCFFKEMSKCLPFVFVRLGPSRRNLLTDWSHWFHQMFVFEHSVYIALSGICLVSSCGIFLTVNTYMKLNARCYLIIIFAFTVPINSIREIRSGKTTDVFRNKELAGGYSTDCSFSIIYGDNFEVLDLVASTPDEANIWATGLNALVGANKCNSLLYYLNLSANLIHIRRIIFMYMVGWNASAVS